MLLNGGQPCCWMVLRVGRRISAERPAEAACNRSGGWPRKDAARNEWLATGLCIPCWRRLCGTARLAGCVLGPSSPAHSGSACIQERPQTLPLLSPPNASKREQYSECWHLVHESIRALPVVIRSLVLSMPRISFCQAILALSDFACSHAFSTVCPDSPLPRGIFLELCKHF